MATFLSSAASVLLGLFFLVATADAAPPSNTSQSASIPNANCVDREVWKPTSSSGAGGFVQVKACFTTCTGGSDTKECAKTDKCFCRCLPNGLPECTCHPQGDPPKGQVKAAEPSTKTSTLAMGTLR